MAFDFFSIVNFEFLLKVGGGIGGLMLFFRGLTEYRRNSSIKRAEFLDRLIADFSRKENQIALRMLDDFVYVKPENSDALPHEQAVRDDGLAIYLRNHRNPGNAITEEYEIVVRNSFDSLFDFFTKLSYYLQNNLITPKELIYFQYYIDKIKTKKEALGYVRIYFYYSDFEKLFQATAKLSV